MKTYVVIATLTNGRHINRTINNVYLAKQLMKMFLMEIIYYLQYRIHLI